MGPSRFLCFHSPEPQSLPLPHDIQAPCHHPISSSASPLVFLSQFWVLAPILTWCSHFPEISEPLHSRLSQTSNSSMTPLIHNPPNYFTDHIPPSSPNTHIRPQFPFSHCPDPNLPCYFLNLNSPVIIALTSNFPPASP